MAAEPSSWHRELEQALNEQVWGRGVVVCLAPRLAEADLDLLLAAARQVLAEPTQRLGLVLYDGIGASFAKSLPARSRASTAPGGSASPSCPR